MLPQDQSACWQIMYYAESLVEETSHRCYRPNRSTRSGQSSQLSPEHAKTNANKTTQLSSRVTPWTELTVNENRKEFIKKDTLYQKTKDTITSLLLPRYESGWCRGKINQ